MTAELRMLVREFGITIANGDVWLAIGLALVLGCVCLAFGTWVARTVGLLRSDAPAGETVGVGLASGLIVLAAVWAAIRSGGQSSFTPVALGFVLAISVAMLGRLRRRRAVQDADPDPAHDDGEPRAPRRSLVNGIIGGGLFVVAIALLYGSTMAPSPRDGVQPVEMHDVAFYAVLGRDLAASGIESNLWLTGFVAQNDVPPQVWYHWGELWLASAVIAAFGTAPLAARSFVVLPLVLLASAALAGTIVRRLTTWDSRRGFLYGFAAYLFLAPVPLIAGGFFSVVAAEGMIFGINLYGLAAAAVLLALHSVVVLNQRRPSWALAIFVGSAIVAILPAHIALALMAAVAVGAVGMLRIGHSVVRRHRLPAVSPIWRNVLVTVVIAGLVTIIWGMLTGHSVGSSRLLSDEGATGPLPGLVSPFNADWRDGLVHTFLGSGVFLAILVALPLVRRGAPLQADLFVGTLAMLFVGAIVWGARLADFTAFYLFFGGLAAIAMPVAVVAVRTLWERLRAMRRLRPIAGVLVVLSILQIEVGVWSSTLRMQQYGPKPEVEPIPVSLLAAIRELPDDAKLAYVCSPYSETTFAVPQLGTIDLHAGRRVVPICFNAEVLSVMSGADASDREPNRYFASAPQRILYPNAASRPSSAAVAAFLKEHAIGYIFADTQHPNNLVETAIPIATDGDSQVLRVP